MATTITLPDLSQCSTADLEALDRAVTELSVITDALLRARKMDEAGDIEARDSWLEFARLRRNRLPVEWRPAM